MCKGFAKSQKCATCISYQHLKCTLVKKADRALYLEGKKQLSCINCLRDPQKMALMLENNSKEINSDSNIKNNDPKVPTDN